VRHGLTLSRSLDRPRRRFQLAPNTGEELN